MENSILSEATVASLSSCIQAKLKKSAPAPAITAVKNRKVSENGQQSKKKQKKDRKQNKPEDGVLESRLSAANRTTVGKPLTKASRSSKLTGDRNSDKKDGVDGQIPGKKRSRDGAFKKAGDTATQSEDLRHQIMDLGGDQDDFDIVDGEDSESLVEGSVTSLAPDVNAELRKMVKDIGISRAREEELSESEESQAELSMQPEKVATKIASSPSKNESHERPSSGLIFEPTPEWHKAEAPLLPEISRSANVTSFDQFDRLFEHSKNLLKKENENYSAQPKKFSSAQQFYSVIMTSGTLSDKISALTLSVQESPLHNVRALETLVGLARKRSRAQAIEVLTALKDLFGSGSLLPLDRHLYRFTAQPGLKNISAKELQKWKPGISGLGPIHEKHLLLWAYEDWLKSTYLDVLKIIEIWCNDEIVFARTKAVDMVYELLRDKPEQESNLLRMLVNKLGDSEKKIASRASYNILQIQIPHRLMKPHIISAIEADILFRPGQSLHAKYYAVLTLNQTVLSSKEGPVAKQIMDLHFGFFLSLLNKSDSEKQAAKAIVLNKKGELQGGGGKPGKLASKKLESKQKGPSVEDEMREKIISAVLTGINRALPFTDTTAVSFEKHMDALFRITHSFNFNTSVQALMLLQQLSRSHQGVSDRFYRTLYESLLDPRLLTSSKHILYLDLLYRALQNDLNLKRVKAFAKRLMQIASMHNPPFACGIIYLLRELEKTFVGLTALMDQPEEGLDDQEETYRDVPEDNASVENNATEKEQKVHSPSYDGKKRAPEFSNAEKSCLWELDLFTSHYHPAVRKFADRLISHEPMPPKPDLETLNRSHFLNSFVHQNPKKDATKWRGTSLMQPRAASDNSKSLFTNSFTSIGGATPDLNGFVNMPAEDVDASAIFLHTFHSLKAKGKKAGEKKKAKRARDSKEDSDEGSNEDGDDEEEIWQALIDSKPEIEGGDSDSLADLEMDDFSDFSTSDKGSPGLHRKGMETSTAEDSEPEQDDDVMLDFDEGEEDAMLDSDEEIPVDLDKEFEKETVAYGREQEDVGGRNKERKNNRKRLKNLPTFASMEDYAELLGDDEND